MKFNYDDKRRCEIIGLEYPVDYWGGCCSFKGLTLDQLNLLLDEGFADPDEQQNSAPDTSEFKSFLEEYPKATLHGYIISPDRDDYRVTIEGLEYDGEVSKEMLSDFIEMFRFADDFNVGDDFLNCWFD
jgi:hypothetical protein